jgi:hypothetical protein
MFTLVHVCRHVARANMIVLHYRALSKEERLHFPYDMHRCVSGWDQEILRIPAALYVLPTTGTRLQKTEVMYGMYI